MNGSENQKPEKFQFPNEALMYPMFTLYRVTYNRMQWSHVKCHTQTETESVLFCTEKNYSGPRFELLLKSKQILCKLCRSWTEAYNLNRYSLVAI